MSVLDDIVGAIKANKTFLLTTHLNPDGDGLGSELALAPVLKKMGKQVTIANHQGVPGLYRFLPGSGEVKDSVGPAERFDVIIAFECPDRSRLGLPLDLATQAGQVINIDHHAFNENYGTLNWVEPKVSAVGEQAYRLILALGGRIDAAIAACLFTALYTDTGGFRYGNTTKESLAIAAELVGCGLKPEQVTTALLEQNPLSRVKLQGLALATLQTESDGKVAWVEVTVEMMKKSGAQDWETENIVDYPRSLATAQVGILFKEVGPAKVKVSLRSKGQVDTLEISKVFGGGGHPAASGCTVLGSLTEVRAKVLAEVKKHLV